jgi:hypothetical protein
MADPTGPLNIADALERKIAAFAETVLPKLAEKARQYATAEGNPPWEDRTGSARKLIKGIVLDGKEKSYDVYTIEVKTKKDKDGKTLYDGKRVKKGTVTLENSEGYIGIALVHRVDYGKYLEEANDGRYGILEKTLQSFESEFKAKANEFFGGKG